MITRLSRSEINLWPRKEKLKRSGFRLKIPLSAKNTAEKEKHKTYCHRFTNQFDCVITEPCYWIWVPPCIALRENISSYQYQYYRIVISELCLKTFSNISGSRVLLIACVCLLNWDGGGSVISQEVQPQKVHRGSICATFQGI